MADVKFKAVSDANAKKLYYDKGSDDHPHFEKEIKLSGQSIYYVDDSKKKTDIYGISPFGDYECGMREVPDQNGDGVPEVVVKVCHAPFGTAKKEKEPSFILLESIPPKKK